MVRRTRPRDPRRRRLGLGDSVPGRGVVGAEDAVGYRYLSCTSWTARRSRPWPTWPRPGWAMRTLHRDEATRRGRAAAAGLVRGHHLRLVELRTRRRHDHPREHAADVRPHHPRPTAPTRSSDMPHNLYLVFSEKPDHVSDADYHRWYVDHAQENIESTGFVSAQRYRVREVARARRSAPSSTSPCTSTRATCRSGGPTSRPVAGGRDRAARLVQPDPVQELAVRADRRPAPPEDPLIRVRTAFRQRMASTPRMFLPACMSA